VPKTNDFEDMIDNAVDHYRRLAENGNTPQEVQAIATLVVAAQLTIINARLDHLANVIESLPMSL
jgi:hypothetical protein